MLLVGPPGDVKFVDVNRDGYITPPGKNTFGDPGDQVVIGNFTPPRYEFGLRLGADYKGFDASVFFPGSGEAKNLGCRTIGHTRISRERWCDATSNS